MASLGKCMKIRHIVRLRQIVKKWRKLVSSRKTSHTLLGFKMVGKCSCPCPCPCLSSSSCAKAVPEDVPAGHLAVYVGQQCTSRFVIRATYLNHPVFKALLEQAEEEFGYSSSGALAIPCDESLFEHILRLFGSHDSKSIRQLDLEDLKTNFCSDWNCSAGAHMGAAPLLHVFAEKSIGRVTVKMSELSRPTWIVLQHPSKLLRNILGEGSKFKGIIITTTTTSERASKANLLLRSF